MNFGCFHQDCIEKLKEKRAYSRLAGTELRRDRKSVNCVACIGQ